MIRRVFCTLALILAPGLVSAHGLVVFASTDCKVVLVEVKFSNGRVARQGEVALRDGENALLATLSLDENGTVRIPLEGVDHSGGLLIEVDTGGHDNYWILTPEDIAQKCGS